MPIGTVRENGASRVRRAGLLVTAASAGVAVATLLVAGLVAPSSGRTTVLLVLLVASFLLAGWRAVRARRDPTEPVGLRSLPSWLAAFSWAATLVTVLVVLATPPTPGAGGRAVIAGLLAGAVLVALARLVEHREHRD